ncbi:flagellar protein FlaG [Oceanobacillus rekensis]|uniref:flagellar protein FlaG n=1 Tax=Oceanobacillus rekensis TaxID=937927 RepID=UPI00318309DD
MDRVEAGFQTLPISENSVETTTVVEGSEIRANYKQVQTQEQKSIINNEDLGMAVSKMNELVDPLRRNIKFELHDKLG